MGKVIELMDERGNQPGEWLVTIGRGEAEPILVNCVNRPAITFGEDMLRVADVEFERWMPRRGIEEIDVQMSSKKTLLMLIDEFGADQLQAYAHKMRAESTETEDFHAAAILQCALDTYNAVGKFMIGEDDNGGV